MPRYVLTLPDAWPADVETIGMWIEEGGRLYGARVRVAERRVVVEWADDDEAAVESVA
jgi:hypothetical protein